MMQRLRFCTVSVVEKQKQTFAVLVFFSHKLDVCLGEQPSSPFVKHLRKNFFFFFPNYTGFDGKTWASFTSGKTNFYLFIQWRQYAKQAKIFSRPPPSSSSSLLLTTLTHYCLHDHTHTHSMGDHSCQNYFTVRLQHELQQGSQQIRSTTALCCCFCFFVCALSASFCSNKHTLQFVGRNTTWTFAGVIRM